MAEDRWSPPLPAYRCEGCGRPCSVRARARVGRVRRLLRIRGKLRALCSMCRDGELRRRR